MNRISGLRKVSKRHSVGKEKKNFRYETTNMYNSRWCEMENEKEKRLITFFFNNCFKTVLKSKLAIYTYYLILMSYYCKWHLKKTVEWKCDFMFLHFKMWQKFYCAGLLDVQCKIINKVVKQSLHFSPCFISALVRSPLSCLSFKINF